MSSATVKGLILRLRPGECYLFTHANVSYVFLKAAVKAAAIERKRKFVLREVTAEEINQGLNGHFVERIR